MKSFLLTFSALLVGCLIFIGLPLLGWGPRQIPAFFSDPARLTYTGVILILQIFSLLYNSQLGRSQENRQETARPPILDLILIQVFSLAVVLVAPFTDGRGLGVAAWGEGGRYLGLLILIPGFILMQVAEKTLARQFSVMVTLQKNHRLIKTGPYKRIRHPRYLGILLFFAGISLTFLSLTGLIIVVVLFGVLAWRVQAEETLLRSQFGREWDLYCRNSWRLIPYIF